jgi:hypothetical protein
MSVFARLEDGWIRVPYAGPELARVEMAVGEIDPGAWQPAFMNTVHGERVVQIRPTGVGLTQTPKVWVRTDGVAVLIGRIGQVPATRPHRRR